MSGSLKQKSCIKILRDFDQHQTESVLNSEHCLHALTEQRGGRPTKLKSNVDKFEHMLASPESSQAFGFWTCFKQIK